jgi:hypothetical protein
MSLLVSGIVFQARVDTRLAQVHLARAKAVAAGDGAINLFLAEFVAGNDRGSRGAGPVSVNYTVGDQAVGIELVAINGLINLRSAPRNLLVSMFRLGNGVSLEEAQTMAANVVKLKASQRAGDNRDSSNKIRFNAIEDLLRVEGMNRAALDAARDLVVVGGSGNSRGADWSAAPPAVLAVLSDAYPEKAASYAAGENGNNKPAGGRTGSSGGYRIDALVRYGDQTWLRRRWFTLGGSASGQLPWRFYRTEPVRVVAAG